MSDARFAGIEARLAALEARSSAVAPTSSAAVEADISGQYGDVEIRKDPTAKYYSGDFSGVGKKMSQCPPDYLLAFAKYKGACAYMGEKEAARLAATDAAESEKKAKYAGYDKRDGARALAWAAKLSASAKSDADEDAIPF